MAAHPAEPSGKSVLQGESHHNYSGLLGLALFGQEYTASGKSPAGIKYQQQENAVKTREGDLR